VTRCPGRALPGGQGARRSGSRGKGKTALMAALLVTVTETQVRATNKSVMNSAQGTEDAKQTSRSPMGVTRSEQFLPSATLSCTQ